MANKIEQRFLANPGLAPILTKYRQPITHKAVVQLSTSLLPLLALWILTILSLRVHYLLTLVLCLPTVGFLVRVFIIQHDCGHGSFFRTKVANNAVGSILGCLTGLPYQYWRHTHAQHHATSGNLDRHGVGDIWTLTVDQYYQRTWLKRLAYRTYRFPLVLFVLGPPFVFVFLNRFPEKNQGKQQGSGNIGRASIWWTDLALAMITITGCLVFGWKPFLLVQAIVVFLSSIIGTWLFYVQHQFEDTYWEQSPNWNFYWASLKGSSYYRLPPLLQWFTGNIGFHHIHHLNPLIPNYRLEEAHNNSPELQVPGLSLLDSLKTAKLALWDPTRKRLVTFKEAATTRPLQLEQT